MAKVGERIRTIGTEECSKCMSNQVEIYDSRLIDGDRIRKRRCLNCGHRWRTKEVRI